MVHIKFIISTQVWNLWLYPLWIILTKSLSQPIEQKVTAGLLWKPTNHIDNKLINSTGKKRCEISSNFGSKMSFKRVMKGQNTDRLPARGLFHQNVNAITACQSECIRRLGKTIQLEQEAYLINHPEVAS